MCTYYDDSAAMAVSRSLFQSGYARRRKLVRKLEGACAVVPEHIAQVSLDLGSPIAAAYFGHALCWLSLMVHRPSCDKSAFPTLSKQHDTL